MKEKRVLRPKTVVEKRRIFLFVLSPLNFTTVDTAKQVF